MKGDEGQGSNVPNDGSSHVGHGSDGLMVVS